MADVCEPAKHIWFRADMVVPVRHPNEDWECAECGLFGSTCRICKGDGRIRAYRDGRKAKRCDVCGGQGIVAKSRSSNPAV